MFNRHHLLSIFLLLSAKILSIAHSFEYDETQGNNNNNNYNNQLTQIQKVDPDNNINNNNVFFSSRFLEEDGDDVGDDAAGGNSTADWGFLLTVICNTCEFTIGNLFNANCSLCYFPDDGFDYSNCNTTQPYLINNGYCNVNYNTDVCNFDGGDCAGPNAYNDFLSGLMSGYFGAWTGLASTLGICIVCCCPFLLPIFTATTFCFGSCYCVALAFYPLTFFLDCDFNGTTNVTDMMYLD